MQYTVFDIEGDGLYHEITKIHCFSYQKFDRKVLLDSGSITDYEEMKTFLSQAGTLVGHNIIRYDIPVLEKILQIEVKNTLIDTLGISWAMEHDIRKHGLEAWGERLGFLKPKVEDWENLPIEVYIERCESDVEINVRLFHYQMQYAMSLYGQRDQVLRYFGYISFKLDCIKQQEQVGIPLDISLATENKLNLEFEIEEKRSLLSAIMPKVPAKKKKPKNMHKKDGTISALGVKWYKLLEELHLPPETEILYESGNPGSSSQIKTWLFSLGWKPQTFKVSPSSGEKLPQISLPFGRGLCPSVLHLFETTPELKPLEGLFVLIHRLSIFNAYLDSLREDGRVEASADGFARTLRLQHKKPIVNLPGVKSLYGKEIRGCLTTPNSSYTMVGSDISGLEDNTKQHYIYIFDPEYVKEMRVKDFDPHLDIGVRSELITKEEAEFYVWYKKNNH